MKKQIKKIGNLALIIMLGLLVLTGCGKKEPKIETEKLTQEMRNYKLTVEVPKEKGYKFVEKLEEKPKFAMSFPDYVLDGEKVQVFFDETSYVYQTSIILKEKYPEMDTENPNFDDFLKYNQNGYTEKNIVDINGLRAIKIENEYGPAGNTILVGYTYFIERKNSDKYIEMKVIAKNENDDIAALMKEPDVKVIIDSIKISYKNK